MSTVRWAASWEQHLFDRVGPAVLCVWILVQKLAGFGATMRAAGEGSGPYGAQLAADLAHQLVSILVFALIVGLFVGRRAPIGPRSNAFGAMTALAGTSALAVLVVPPTPASSVGVLAASVALGVTGVLLTLVGLATLGRCFG